MAQLHTITPLNSSRRRRRVGRGGKRGTYSGRGMKGQKSRSGARIRPAIRDLIKRLPKLRGTSGRVASGHTGPAAKTVTLAQLKHFAEGASVTMVTLEKAGIIHSKVLPAKIVATGTSPKKLNIIGVPISAGAAKAVKAAGGTVKHE